MKTSDPNLSLDALPIREPMSGYPSRLVAIDDMLKQRLGDTYHDLCEESLKCLRTQMIWSEIAPSLGDLYDMSPAVLGAKALELELNRRVLTPAFIEGVWSDLDEGLYPWNADAALRKTLGSLASEALTLGQCAAVLRTLAGVRHRSPGMLERSAVGRHLRLNHLDYTFIDCQFVEELQELVDRYRNPSAHRALSPQGIQGFEDLLLGKCGEGLLPFLIQISRPRGCYR